LSGKTLVSSSNTILTKSVHPFDVDKDMSNEDYRDEIDPQDYPDFFPNMAPLIEDNIVVGDKNEEERFVASYWNDLGDDIFDDWGYFYLYDPNIGKYYFPIFSPQNEADGLIFTQIFDAFGRTFTIKQGWGTYGVFKIDISVNDNNPFKFGAYGNMGSDGNEDNSNLTYPYTLNSSPTILYYLKQSEIENDVEIFYSYFIPKNQSENNSITYDFYIDGDKTSLMSKDVTQGILVYFAKTLDAKNWVISNVQQTLQ
jgi:hypothetical protein